MKHVFDSTVADVATPRKHYVPPQIEVVDLDIQYPILVASNTGNGNGNGNGTAGWGNGISRQDYPED